MIGVVNNISLKSHAGTSFGKDKKAKNDGMPPLPDNFYTNISKTSTNNAIRNALYKSKGREEKNGKLSLATGLTYGTGMFLFVGSAVSSLVKSPKEASAGLLKAFSPKNILKNFPLKAGVLLMLAGIGINTYNNLDAKRTAKQRGVKNSREAVVTSPELEKLNKQTEELEKLKNAELTKLYSAEYDTNMAIYQKVLADAPMKYFSFEKPVSQG